MKYLGIFLLAVGFSLMWFKRKSDHGKETWESTHNIGIRKWQYILCIILGVVCIFGTNFHANFSTENSDKTKKETSSILPREENDSKEVEKETADESSVATSKELAKGDVTDLDQSGVTGTTENAVDDVNHTLKFIYGFLLDISYSGSGEFKNSEQSVCSITNDNNRYIMYTDSHVAVNDTEAILKEFSSSNYDTDNIYQYSLVQKSGATNFLPKCSLKKVYGSLNNSNGYGDAMILEDVGASTYLAIEITDYSNSYTLDDLASEFVIKIS